MLHFFPDTMQGKDGTRWQPYTGRNRVEVQNIMRRSSGLTAYALSRTSNELSAFRLLFSQSISQNMISCTKTEARRQNDMSFSLDSCAFDQFVGICIARGVLCSNTSVRSLWDKNWGCSLIKQTMARDRFLQIMKYLRFDVKSTRSLRLQEDKFALVSTMWKDFVDNCQRCYNPNTNLTVDEQLLSTKSRCPFQQYMANKPDKFGIKLWMLVDNETKYFVNGFPYLGRDPERRTTNLGTHVVMKLMSPFFNNGHNVTTDNFFTSLELARQLKSKGTSIVGTLRGNRREMPPINSLRLAYHETKCFMESSCNASLTVYQAKRKKHVAILSTLHTSGISVQTEGKKKPETILFYNKTKCGVDVLDAMIRMYSTKSPSRRWPLAIFYNILDIALINSWIIYRTATNSSMSRRNFILNVCKELCSISPIVSTLPSSTSSTSIQQRPSTASSSSRKRTCTGTCNRNRAVGECGTCQKAVCGKCSAKVRRVVELKCNECQ